MNTFRTFIALFSGLAFFLIPNSIYSQEGIKYFSPGDSLIIKESRGEFYTDHIIQKKQTLYSLSRYYKCNIKEIIDLNPILNERIVETGDTISIPFHKDNMKQEPPLETNSNYLQCFYDVKKKETLFRIARRHFDMPISQLRKMNKIKGNDISIGSKLFVGWYEMSWDKKDPPITDSLITTETKDSSSTGLPELVAAPGKVIVAEKGAALINQSAGGGFFALHSKAEPGSFIEITHPTSKRSLQVKVLAKLPENTYTKDVKIVVSPAVANMLGAENSRFFVLLRYLRNK